MVLWQPVLPQEVVIGVWWGKLREGALLIFWVAACLACLDEVLTQQPGTLWLWISQLLTGKSNIHWFGTLVCSGFPRLS